MIEYIETIEQFDSIVRVIPLHSSPPSNHLPARTRKRRGKSRPRRLHRSLVRALQDDRSRPRWLGK